MPLDLYYMPESPPCRAVELVADLVGADLNKKLINLCKQEHLNDDFIKLNPQHCVPTLVEDDLIIWESRAIMAYLVNKFRPGDSLYPFDAKQRARIDHMLYFDMGTLFKTQCEYLKPKMEGKRILDANNEKKFREALRLLELAVGTKNFCTGDKLTIADISIVCSLSVSEATNYNISNFTTVTGYLNRVKEALPNYEQFSKDAIDRFRNLIKTRQKC